MHREPMRRLALASTLLLAACATRPQQPVQQPTTAAPAPRSNIIGLTASELVAHFGRPALQVREGPGTKLQFRSRRCVLDVYLYGPDNNPAGVPRVSHVDARLPPGADTDQAACISALENPS